MKPTRVAVVMKRLLQTRWPVFVWGPPGAGKSSVVRQVAAEGGLSVIDIRASLLDPTDLRGIPAIQNGRAVWAPPSFLPKEGDGPGGILFFDELSAAPPLVQASLYQLVLDRRVGEYVLPDGWRIVAAGNRQEDRSVVFRMPAALANRFVHLDFEVDYDDWRAWAVGNGVHPLLIGFLGLRRELLIKVPDGVRAFPTPRSWEIASDGVKALGFDGSVMDVLIGIVGDGAAVEFLGYCESALREEQVRAIVARPADAELPTDLGGLYALVSYLTALGSERGVLRASGTLLPRLPIEFSVLLVRDLLKVNPGFVADPGYIAFIREHQELLR